MSDTAVLKALDKLIAWLDSQPGRVGLSSFFWKVNEVGLGYMFNSTSDSAIIFRVLDEHNDNVLLASVGLNDKN